MSDDPLFHDEDHKRGISNSTLDHVRRQLLKTPLGSTTKGARWDNGSTGLGQFSVWKSDAPGARDHTILHPEVAKYLRVDPRWMTVLAEGLRALDDSSGPVDTIGKRQRRLGRALGILNFVMEHHPDLAELNIREDLAVLGLALVSLEAGVVHPLLRKPAGFGNRPPDTRLSQQFRVNILTFVVILERTGMTRNNALRYVAGELSKENVGALKPKAGDKTLAFNWLTIKGWYYRAGLQSPATSAVDASNDDAVKVAASIAEFVARAFADRQSIPPPLEYAKRVIRDTMRSAAFRTLAPGGGA